jgi:hypothetical protein
MAARTDRPNTGTYRRQLIAMLDDETADRIEADAAKPGASKAGVIRRYLDLGIKRHDALERAKVPALASAAPILDGPVD